MTRNNNWYAYARVTMVVCTFLWLFFVLLFMTLAIIIWTDPIAADVMTGNL